MATGIQAARNLGRDVAADGMRKDCGLTELKEMSAEEHTAYCAGWDEKANELEAWNALSPQERQALSLKQSEEFAAECTKQDLARYVESLKKAPVIRFGGPSVPDEVQAAEDRRLAYCRGIEKGIKQWAEEQLKPCRATEEPVAT